MKLRPAAWKCISDVLFLFLFISCCVIPTNVFSATIFVGIGNDGYFNDVIGLRDAISSGLYLNDDFRAYTFEDREGSEVLETILGLQGVFNSGDTLIWYYSGHSRRVYDGTEHDETGPSSWAESKYDEAIGIKGHTDRVTDDELSNAFSSISQENANIITIFDTCYAGGFVGGEKDLNMVPGLTFMGSSGETEDSYSINGQSYSVFTQGLINALSDDSADYDGNRILTTGEWLKYASSYIESTIVGSKQHVPPLTGQNISVGRTLPVPLPSAFVLLAGGIAAFKLRLSAVGRGLKAVSACSTFRH